MKGETNNNNYLRNKKLVACQLLISYIKWLMNKNNSNKFSIIGNKNSKTILDKIYDTFNH